MVTRCIGWSFMTARSNSGCRQARMLPLHRINRRMTLSRARCSIDACSAARAMAVRVPLSMLPDEALDAVSRQMEALDPGASVSFAVDCPECATRWAASLDVGQLVWQQVRTAAERLFLDVDALARAYGWTEQRDPEPVAFPSRRVPADRHGVMAAPMMEYLRGLAPAHADARHRAVVALRSRYEIDQPIRAVPRAAAPADGTRRAWSRVDAWTGESARSPAGDRQRACRSRRR